MEVVVYNFKFLRGMYTKLSYFRAARLPVRLHSSSRDVEIPEEAEPI